MSRRTLPATTQRTPLQGPSTPPSPSVVVTAGAARYLTVDHGLRAAGLASAVASCAFAVVMIAHNNGPDVPRTSYFSVFAQLRDKAVGSRGAPSATNLGEDVDPIVTGSIQPRSGSAAADPAAATLEGFSLREVFGSTALIDSPTGLQVVRRGSTLLGAGPVTAVTRQGARVVVTTPKGVIWKDVD